MFDRCLWWRGRSSSALIRRATAEGAWAARAGEYDEWSFAADSSIAYLVRLDHEKEMALAGERQRLGYQLQQVRRSQRAEDIRLRTANDRAEAAVESARRRRDLHCTRHDRTLRELDLLASAEYPPPADLPNGDPPARHWMGPADGTLAPPVPRLLKIVLVLVLAAIEVPIHFLTFQAFHPRDPALTWCFTLPVALCMVLGPHLAGIWMRRRLAVPSLGKVPAFAAAALMAVWLGAAVVLADLRSTTLLATTEVNGVFIESSVNHLGHSTLIAVFGLLIVLSGLIAFLLGIAENHPGVAALRAADRSAERAERDFLAARTAHAGAGLDVIEDRDDEAAELEKLCEHRIAAIDAEYRAARAAYLDAVALAVGNPSVTQAIGAIAAVPV